MEIFVFLFVWHLHCQFLLLLRESPEHEVKMKTNRSRQRNQMEFKMQLAHQMLGAFLSKRRDHPMSREQPQRTFLTGLLWWKKELANIVPPKKSEQSQPMDVRNVMLTYLLSVSSLFICQISLKCPKMCDNNLISTSFSNFMDFFIMKKNIDSR